jgi:glutaminyl-tRNA synthetase
MAEPEVKAANFIRHIVESDLASGKYASRRWSGKPGAATQQLAGAPDPAKIRTRFPPEPNGYLHFGHAKSILLNFGLAQDFGGSCHLRFDDTNPEKEEQEYVDAIISAVQWLGCDWNENLYHASDYFDFMYEAAEYLIQSGNAYVDSQSADAMRASRGTLTEPGRDSPFRTRSVTENLALFRRMRAGEFADGTHILRAKIDMAAPNINLRDPAIYRIRHAEHHRTGNKWCLYPMYTYAHPIEDALENITHSICTLEFEDQRPFYDWLMEKLADGGLLAQPVPRQYEFSRLNLSYVVLSKRKLIQLVEESHVDGWDDPRMPTLVGARRRGFTAQGFRLFAERIGVSKSDSWIDMSVLEECMREHLNETALRRIAVLDPLKLIIDNCPDDHEELCEAPNHPQHPELGKRPMPFSRELWIEREDYMEVPSKGYFRLFPGNTVRLRYGFVVKCIGADKDANGNIVAVHCEYLPDSKSGTPGADTYKVKGNLHWVSARHAYRCEVRLYDRLFSAANPGAGERDFLLDLNPDSRRVVAAQLEPSLKAALAEQRFQFERHGYFVADQRDSAPGAPVFNRAVTLKDSWGKP